MVRASTSETNPDGGGSGIKHDCDCHLMCEKVELSHGNQDGVESLSVKCEFVVLASTVKEEVGKKINEFFPVAGKAAGKFLNLAVAAALITKDQWRQAREQAADIEIDENQLRGRQICAEVRLEKYVGKKVEYQGKSFANIGFRTYHPLDPKCTAWPKDQDAIQFVTYLVGDDGGSVQDTSEKHTPSTPAATGLW